MSHNNYKNYNNYHKQNNRNGYQPTEPLRNTTPPNVTSSAQPTLIVDDIVDVVEEPEVVEEPKKPVFGVVSGCAKLNIRKSPSTNGNVVCVVEEKTELMISLDESTNDWYSVYNSAGLNGFCMKKFITIKQ